MEYGVYSCNSCTHRINCLCVWYSNSLPYYLVGDKKRKPRTVSVCFVIGRGLLWCECASISAGRIVTSIYFFSHALFGVCYVVCVSNVPTVIIGVCVYWVRKIASYLQRVSDICVVTNECQRATIKTATVFILSIGLTLGLFLPTH